MDPAHPDSFRSPEALWCWSREPPGGLHGACVPLRPLCPHGEPIRCSDRKRACHSIPSGEGFPGSRRLVWLSVAELRDSSPKNAPPESCLCPARSLLSSACALGAETAPLCSGCPGPARAGCGERPALLCVLAAVAVPGPGTLWAPLCSTETQLGCACGQGRL